MNDDEKIKAMRQKKKDLKSKKKAQGRARKDPLIDSLFKLNRDSGTLPKSKRPPN